MEIAGVTQKREIPTKWRNPWKGPGNFLKKISNTECEISLFGKTKMVNYNRVGPFTPWDLITVSSDEWNRRMLKKDKEVGVEKKFHPKWVYLFKTGVGFFEFAPHARTKWLNELVMRCMR